MTDRERKIARTKKRPKCAISYLIWIESLHMTPRRPYWCSKTMKRQSCWCSMLISCGSWTLFLGKRIFFPINLHKCYPPEWKRSIRGQREWMDRENGFLHVGFVHCCFWLQLHSSMIFSWLAKTLYKCVISWKILGLSFQWNNHSESSKFVSLFLQSSHQDQLQDRLEDPQEHQP